MKRMRIAATIIAAAALAAFSSTPALSATVIPLDTVKNLPPGSYTLQPAALYASPSSRSARATKVPYFTGATTTSLGTPVAMPASYPGYLPDWNVSGRRTVQLTTSGLVFRDGSVITGHVPASALYLPSTQSRTSGPFTYVASNTTGFQNLSVVLPNGRVLARNIDPNWEGFGGIFFGPYAVLCEPATPGGAYCGKTLYVLDTRQARSSTNPRRVVLPLVSTDGYPVFSFPVDLRGPYLSATDDHFNSYVFNWVTEKQVARYNTYPDLPSPVLLEGATIDGSAGGVLTVRPWASTAGPRSLNVSSCSQIGQPQQALGRMVILGTCLVTLNPALIPAQNPRLFGGFITSGYASPSIGKAWREALDFNEGLAQWRFTVTNASGNAVFISTGTAKDGSVRLAWSGRRTDGTACPAGTYTWAITGKTAEGWPLINTLGGPVRGSVSVR